MLDHVQSGNIFVVDDICHVGGYENTLLGYKTRLYTMCKEHLQHFDIILFGTCNNYKDNSCIDIEIRRREGEGIQLVS